MCCVMVRYAAQMNTKDFGGGSIISNFLFLLLYAISRQLVLLSVRSNLGHCLKKTVKLEG